MNLPIKTIITCLVTLLLFSCATTPDKFEQLDASLKTYERSLRWQNYDTIIAIHKNEHERLTPAMRKKLKRYRVTAYEEVYRKQGSEGGTLSQVVEIKYYNQEYAIVRELTLKNEWEYDEKRLRWYLLNPLPAFR